MAINEGSREREKDENLLKSRLPYHLRSLTPDSTEPGLSSVERQIDMWCTGAKLVA